jgi:hypothetical protein
MRSGVQLPNGFTREDLLEAGLTEHDCDEVLAFREFLQVADRAPDPDGQVKLHVPQPWHDYALGKITGAQALEKIAEARP